MAICFPAARKNEGAFLKFQKLVMQEADVDEKYFNDWARDEAICLVKFGKKGKYTTLKDEINEMDKRLANVYMECTHKQKAKKNDKNNKNERKETEVEDDRMSIDGGDDDGTYPHLAETTCYMVEAVYNISTLHWTPTTKKGQAVKYLALEDIKALIGLVAKCGLDSSIFDDVGHFVVAVFKRPVMALYCKNMKSTEFRSKDVPLFSYAAGGSQVH